MKKIITGQDDRVAAFVAEHIGMTGKFGSCASIGLEEDGELIAGVIYTDYNGSNVCMHIAAIGKRWCTREFLWFCSYYPFEQIGVKRVTGIVDESNRASINWGEKLGFTFEARLKDAGAHGDLLVYRLFKKDCRFLRIKHG